MSEFNIEVASGASVRLPTEGKYCDRDIVVTAVGGSSGSNDLVNSIIERTITEFNDNAIQTIGSYAFSQCTSLVKVIVPSATTIGNQAFRRCTNLTEINAPLATSIGTESFYENTQLSSVNFPKATQIGSSAFANCKNLNEAIIPLLKSISIGAFSSCGNLTAIDFPSATNIAATAFYNCTLLDKMFLRNDAASCALSNVSAFNKTPFADDGAGGRVFVPRALIETYQTATNWSTLYAAGTCNFLAIEDYTADGTITGVPDWDKINAEV